VKLSIDRQALILDNKLEMWQNTYYDAQIDAKIATDIENDVLLTQATTRMKQALAAIAWLENEITKLEGGDKK
jgi:hypothetical protein